MLNQKQKLNLINLYIDPEIISEEEAKNLLKERGYDLEAAERKRVAALEKLELLKIKFEAEKNKQIFKEVTENTNTNLDKEISSNYKIAARDGSEQSGKNSDAELLEKLKERIKKESHEDI
ncbi:MAG: hypothetical protein Fur0015_01480 [Ignavibacteriales bacterium]